MQWYGERKQNCLLYYVRQHRFSCPEKTNLWNKKINWLTRQPYLWTKQPKIILQNLYIVYKQRFQFPVKEDAFVSVHQHARPRMGRGEGTSDWQGQVTGTISWGQNSEPDKIPLKVLPTKPPKNPRTIINLKEFLSLPESIKISFNEKERIEEIDLFIV